MIGKSISHYSITEKIGEGGMGEVYRARDLKLGRDVGLKLLPELFASDAQRMGRFSREAQLLASLNHPNIASIYGLEEADGGKVLVMELVEGEDLSQRLQRGPIPLTESLELAVQIAEALESAHEKGIIHRDLKPANIKVTPEGKVKVLDFGLAKALEGESEKSSADLTMSPTLSLAATQAGIILGTAAYMSPEQASGLQVDKRADIWSFGVVLFEMLTGGQLFKGETVSHTLADVLRADVDMEALGAATPPAIRSLIRRCLDRNARKRLRDIGEARIAIQEYLANPTKPQDSETVSARPAASQLNKPVVAALLIAAVTVSSLAAWFLKPEPPADSPVKVEAAVWAEQPIPRDQASSAVLSPDGKVLAYITGTSVAETGRLFVRHLNRLDGEFLEGTEGAYNPFFSPDGQWIGYVTARELKKVSVNGGTPLTLCSVSLSRGADWGEQGTIVFAGKPDSGLQQVSVAGGATSEVTSLSEGEVSHRWPQFLPGGKRVLFTSFGSNDRNKGRIEVIDLGSGKRKTILEGGTYGRYSVSGHILYVNNNTLFAASFDPEALELKGMPTPVLEGINMNPEGGAQYSVSLNGTLVYVPGTAEGAKRSLVWFDPQGRETLVSETLKEYRLLRLDPAQRRMALDVFTDGNYDIWVQDLQRDTQTRLTFHESADQNPVWSSDGQYIYFNSNRTGKNGIFRKRADGASEEELLLESADPVFPWSASHDGEYLGYFTQNAGGYDVWVLPLNGEKEPQQLWKSDFGEADLVFSPDDRWLAYDSDESGRWEVYVRPFGSSAGKWQISTDGGEYPRWSADGKRLYYLKAEAVFEVPVTTLGDSFEAGRPVKLLDIPGSRQADVEISTDGQRFYYVKEQGTAGSSGPNLVRFTFNWFEELEQILQTTPVR